MANIVKKTTRDQWLPYQGGKSQNFNQDDAVQGDILKVKDSLGKSAHFVQINSNVPITLRFNVCKTIYQPRHMMAPDSLNSHLGISYNLASGVDYTDESGALISVVAGVVTTFDRVLPVSDIQLVTASGEWNILTI